MKKIIALALALIMALSMGVVALAYYPGDSVNVMDDVTAADKATYKVTYDFTTSSKGYKGISMVESVEWVKDVEASKAAGEPLYDLVFTVKENLTSITSKDMAGEVVVLLKEDNSEVDRLDVDEAVANDVAYIAGDKKAANATPIDAEMLENTVMYAEDGAGYVTFAVGQSLTGLVKVAEGEKAQIFEAAIDDDTMDAIEAYLGEDYDAIVEYYNFAGTGFDADVAFTYEAYAEDPHYFYAWDGEKFVDLEGKYNDDEEVEAYEFTADAKGIIIVTDVEIAAAGAETKNPDTGANDVVGVAAALAVVSLVAAGAVSLKK